MPLIFIIIISMVKDLFEDLIDTLTVFERQDEPTKPFEEIKKEILAQRVGRWNIK